LKRSRQVKFDLFEAAIYVLTLKQAGTSIPELFCEVKMSLRFRILPWRGVAWRGVAWRGVAWRDVAWRGVAVLCNPDICWKFGILGGSVGPAA